MSRIIITNTHNTEISAAPAISKSFIDDRDILKKRSKRYLELIASLDHAVLNDTKGMKEVMKAIQEEFGTAELASLPLGIVAKCFLGHPYEVHTLDLSGSQIIRHYKIAESMEPDFEKARTVAKHNAYAMIEVYKDKIILIREDGSATKI
jgi:hypothetical protein